MTPRSYKNSIALVPKTYLYFIAPVDVAPKRFLSFVYRTIAQATEHRRLKGVIVTEGVCPNVQLIYSFASSSERAYDEELLFLPVKA